MRRPSRESELPPAVPATAATLILALVTFVGAWCTAAVRRHAWAADAHRLFAQFQAADDAQQLRHPAMTIVRQTYADVLGQVPTASAQLGGLLLHTLVQSAVLGALCALVALLRARGHSAWAALVIAACSVGCLAGVGPLNRWVTPIGAHRQAFDTVSRVPGSMITFTTPFWWRAAWCAVLIVVLVCVILTTPGAARGRRTRPHALDRPSVVPSAAAVGALVLAVQITALRSPTSLVPETAGVAEIVPALVAAAVLVVIAMAGALLGAVSPGIRGLGLALLPVPVTLPALWLWSSVYTSQGAAPLLPAWSLSTDPGPFGTPALVLIALAAPVLGWSVAAAAGVSARIRPVPSASLTT